jgi:hypothetical protein
MGDKTVPSVPLCKGGWNYHIIPLGAMRCVLCGFCPYTPREAATHADK